jgi:hypothetical protein
LNVRILLRLLRVSGSSHRGLAIDWLARWRRLLMDRVRRRLVIAVLRVLLRRFWRSGYPLGWLILLICYWGRRARRRGLSIRMLLWLLLRVSMNGHRRPAIGWLTWRWGRCLLSGVLTMCLLGNTRSRQRRRAMCGRLDLLKHMGNTRC